MEDAVPKKKGWNWAEHKPNNMFNITAADDMEFFRWWCTLIHPFVALTPKEIDVISAFLKYRFELAKQVPAELVDTLLMSSDIKNKVVKDCGLSHQHFYVVVSGLRKKNVLSETGINPNLIPNIRENDQGTFQLLILIKEKKEKQDNDL